MQFYALCGLDRARRDVLLNFSFPGCSGAQLCSTGGAALVPDRRIEGFWREIWRTEGPYRPGRVGYTHHTLHHNYILDIITHQTLNSTQWILL